MTAPTFQVALNPTVAVGDTVELLLGGAALAHPVTAHDHGRRCDRGQRHLDGDGRRSRGRRQQRIHGAVFADTAGNTSTTSALTVTLDTTAPTGGTPDLIAASDSGSSNTDNITDVTAPTFPVALNPTVAGGRHRPVVARRCVAGAPSDCTPSRQPM